MTFVDTRPDELHEQQQHRRRDSVIEYRTKAENCRSPLTDPVSMATSLHKMRTNRFTRRSHPIGIDHECFEQRYVRVWAASAKCHVTLQISGWSY